MKQLLVILVALTAFTFCTGSFDKNDELAPTHSNGNNSDALSQTKNKMNITVGRTVFTATLNDNATVKAFKAMLPITINMSDLNANEKFFNFSSALPTNAAPGGSIKAGDLMLYGNNCLVLFYENLNTSYSYTGVGKVDNITGLKAALGTGNITVKLGLQ